LVPGAKGFSFTESAVIFSDGPEAFGLWAAWVAAIGESANRAQRTRARLRALFKVDSVSSWP
jgi:hypothetical protein